MAEMQEHRTLFLDLRVTLPTEGVREKYLQAHHAYLSRLKEEGKLIMGGPFEDHSGAMNIFAVDSAEEAIELCSKDPFVIHGRHKSTVIPWSLRF